jgi:hypothetical protein
VKLAVTARTPADVAAVFDVLGRAEVPTVAIAMGELGRLTRVLAPCFLFSLLTYAAIDGASATAPGQSAVGELLEVYRLDRAGPHTTVHLHVGEPPGPEVVAAANAVEPGGVLHVPLPAVLAGAVVPVLRRHLAGVRVDDGW